VEGSSPLNPSYTFENFVIGRTNQIAFQEARRVAESDAPSANPIFFFGPTGLGKSHLMHAIARQKLLRNPSLRVMLVSAENFMRLFITAIKANDTLAFKNLVRNVDVLLVDDLHFIMGKEATQEELFAALDWLGDHQKQIILSADRSPSLFDTISERARSRLVRGASIEIQPTDFELRLSILESKARLVAKERPGFTLNSEAAHFMAQRIATNTRELEGALTRVVTQSGDGARPITIENLPPPSQRRGVQLHLVGPFEVGVPDLVAKQEGRVIAEIEERVCGGIHDILRSLGDHIPDALLSGAFDQFPAAWAERPVASDGLRVWYRLQRRRHAHWPPAALEKR
jgi:chromosomal replication initiator protein DnaA